MSKKTSIFFFKHNKNKYFIASDFKKLKSLFKKIKIRNEISIIKILAKDIDGPAMIEIGIKENKIKK